MGKNSLKNHLISYPRLNDLPPPPPGKTGWPWNEESKCLPAITTDGHKWPKITVVTPSFNQGTYLEETIRSVLLQRYPNLEYFVMDGGSTDNSVQIIKKYSKWLSYWRSEADNGQSSAVNEGIKMGDGEYATWINSDDMLCKNALFNTATMLNSDESTVYIGDCIKLSMKTGLEKIHRAKIHTLKDLLEIWKVWTGQQGHIVQPEVLFPRSLFIHVGGFNEDFRYANDYELWGKFLIENAKFYYTKIPFGISRGHEQRFTYRAGGETIKNIINSAQTLTSNAHFFSNRDKKKMQRNLNRYYKNHFNIGIRRKFWKGTKRFLKFVFPEYFVIRIRVVKQYMIRKIKKT